MKKSTLLSFVTAGAIVATSVGTYAAWDTLEATVGGTVNFGNPVTVSTDASAAYTTTTRALNTNPKATSIVNFKVVDENSLGTTLKLKGATTDASINDLVDISFAREGTPDTAITEDTAFVKDATGNKYIVTVQPKTTISDEQLATLNNKDITVNVTATLE